VGIRTGPARHLVGASAATEAVVTVSSFELIIPGGPSRRIAEDLVVARATEHEIALVTGAQHVSPVATVDRHRYGQVAGGVIAVEATDGDAVADVCEMEGDPGDAADRAAELPNPNARRAA
jgi:hypothetical protein